MDMLQNQLVRYDQHNQIQAEITQRALTEFLNTVGKHPPETVGMFGGNLDNPHCITEFRFCPPQRNRDGSFNRSGGHVNVDAEYMNFVIDEEWRPRGIDLLGLGHSHPKGCRELSFGDANKNEGDIVFLKSCLENDDSPGKRWHTCFAPILTFDSQGQAIIDWFAVTLKNPRPIPVEIKIIADNSTSTTAPADRLADPAYPISSILMCNRAYQKHISEIVNDPELVDIDKSPILSMLRDLRDADLANKIGQLTASNRSPA